MYVSVYIGKRCLVFKSFSLGSLNVSLVNDQIKNLNTEFKNSNSKSNTNSINLKYSVYIGVRGVLYLRAFPSARLMHVMIKFHHKSSKTRIQNLIQLI